MLAAWLAQSEAPLFVDREDPGSIPGAVRSAGWASGWDSQVRGGISHTYRMP